MILIGILDPKYLLAEALKEKVELSPDFKAEVLHRLSPELFANLGKYDLLLADLSLVFGVDLQERTKLATGLPLLLMSSFVDVHSQIKAYHLGARGVVSKSHRPEVLHRSIFQSIEGSLDLSFSMRNKFKSVLQFPRYVKSLSPEERTLIQILAEGKSIEYASLSLGRKKTEIHEFLQRVFSLMISAKD